MNSPLIDVYAKKGFNNDFLLKQTSKAFVIVFLFLLTIYSTHAATRTTTKTGNWSTTSTWGGVSVPSSTDLVGVNHGLNLNSNLTINAGGVYNFNASNTGGTPSLTMGALFFPNGGELDINSPAYVTMASATTYNGIIHVYSGATLKLTGDLAIIGTQIIVDAGGTLIVGGNFTNTDGAITNNGTITVGGSYAGYSFFGSTTVDGTGTFTTGGSMTNGGFWGSSSTINGSTDNCNAGPCNASCLAGMTTGAISGPTTMCSGVTGIVYSVTAVSGATNYVWAVPSGSTITAGAGTPSITVTAGANPGNITVIASNGTCTSSNTPILPVTVGKPTGTASIAGVTNSCQNTSGVVYTVSGVSNASAFSWTIPSGSTITSGAGTNSITVTMGASSGNITVTPSNSCGNASGSTIGTLNVTLSPAPTAAISYSSNLYCKDNSTDQVPVITGTTGGIFSSSPNGLSLNSATGAITPNSSTSNRTYNITYTALTTGCVDATATTSVKISNNKLNNTAGSISGAISVCQNETGMPYSISAVTSANAMGYVWSLPSGTVATFGANSNSILATFGTVSGTIYVTPTRASDGCMGTTSSIAVTVNSSCIATWTGATSSDWGTISNWNPAIIPSSGDYISIPNVARKPIITTGNVGSVKNITIAANSSVTINSGGALNVYGNVTNNGTLTAASGSSINMVGSTAQTITGVSSVSNLKINNTTGVSVGSAMIVNGTLSLIAGVLTTNSNVTLNFDNGGNIAYSASDAGSISGVVSGKRVVNYKTHYMAAPFAGVTSAQIQATTPLFVNPYWKMNSKNFTAQNWTAIINTTTSLPIGEGYSISFVAAAPLILTGTYNHALSTTTSNYLNTAVDKYFFVGNPYPATIDWESTGITKTNIKGAIYYWDGPNNRAASYVSGLGTNGATQYIPAMQAVLVATNGLGGYSSVGITNTARFNLTNPSYFRVAADDMIRIKLEGIDPSQNDEAIIRFNEMATDSFDIDLDANKILNTGTMPSVYTVSGTTKYSINSYAAPGSAKRIPLLAKLPTDGTYTFNFDNNNPNIQYVLLDNQLGVEKPITESYTFVGTSKDSVNRFELQLRETTVTVPSIPTGLQSGNMSRGLQINSSVKGFILQSSKFVGGVATIELMDVTGNIVKSISNQSITSTSTYVPVDLADGSYIVKVMIDSELFTGLIVLVK